MAALFPILALLMPLSAGPGAPTHDARPNVLLICVDDLRPELGCYGADHAITPALDELSRTARRFERHYVTVPTCGASRASLLTGLVPSKRAHLSNNAIKVRTADGLRDTWIHRLQTAGYTTATLGKVEHWPASEVGGSELSGAWSEILSFDSAPWGTNRDAFFAYADGSVRVPGESPISESPDVPDDAYPDARIADGAVEALQRFADDDEPFLLAVGFFKPHLPFNAPARYRRMYDDVEIPDAGFTVAPRGLPTPNGHGQSGEVTNNYGHAMWDDKQWDAEERRRMRRDYLACVSYVDAQIHRVLVGLEEAGLAESTIVVVWGDHGWHLGELGLMGKHTLYEVALRSPLIVRSPGMANPGEASSAIVSTVDVGSTILDLCGIAEDASDGVSFAPIMRDQSDREHRTAAPSFWSRGPLVGRTVRTQDSRTVEWRQGFDGPLVSVEQYDLLHDPEQRECVGSAVEAQEEND